MAEKKAEEKVMSAYIDRVEAGKAVLIFDDVGGGMEQITVPTHLLPDGAGEGDYLRIAVSFDRERTESAEDEALSLLEESERDSRS